MAGVLRKTTDLVGVAVCESPHERLSISYTKILDVLEHIPKNAAYRNLVKVEPDVKKLEDQLQVIFS
uniref:NADH dehydrogenase [ubiquinone] 1 alpha subcomplex subunit 5 n=1 Tax=Suricata suricatta TaxID=37032 RepID=A0A673TPS3_SURSU